MTLVLPSWQLLVALLHGKDNPGEDDTRDDDGRTQSHDGPISLWTRSHNPKPGADLQLIAVGIPAEDDTVDSDDNSSDDDSRPEDPLALIQE